jgi:hypothetical protein
MEENKYIVWHIEGGLGKNVAATALIGSLKDKYPDRKIVICASYPEVFLNHPALYRVYRVGNTQYFYDDFIKDKDTIVFKHEPYFQTNHILRRKHLIENWCDLLGIDYDNQQPVLNFNLVQQRTAVKWTREKPILVLQTNGGPVGSNLPYSWTRDIPFDVAMLIANKYKDSHHIIQICKESSRQLPNAEIINYSMTAMELFSILIMSDKRILIDSCLQHAAAALNLQSTVLWVGTSPKNFGYVLHNNIIANPPSDTTKLIDAYLFDYSFEGVAHECPYYEINEMFDTTKLLEQL